MNTAVSIGQEPSPGPLGPTLHFSLALLRANLRDLKGLAITLGMPLFLLFTIWVPVMGGAEESGELMRLLFPAIILLSVIMPGLTHATRLTRWREQRILQRFALTPIPVSRLMVGTALAQILIGLAQGTLTLLFGVFVVGLQMAWQNTALVLCAMALAGAAITAYGSMMAAFSRKPDIAGYLFFFTIMPLTFLASFPAEMMPDSLNAVTPWLPASMAIELIGPLFLDNRMSEGALLACAGLAGYAAVFSLLSAKRLR